MRVTLRGSNYAALLRVYAQLMSFRRFFVISVPVLLDLDRDRATVVSFEKGSSSVYALVAKDQLVSFRDLSFANCSAQEAAEMERSARSQREAAEAKEKSKVDSGRRPVMDRDDGFDDCRPVAASPNLVDPRMDEHWRTVGVAAVGSQQEGGSLVVIFGVLSFSG